jgi:hypothetical protein
MMKGKRVGMKLPKFGCSYSPFRSFECDSFNSSYLGIPKIDPPVSTDIRGQPK